MPHFGEWDWMHIKNILNSNGNEWAPRGANIQRAVDDLPAYEGYILLPEGTFDIDVSLLRRGANIIGAGREATTIRWVGGINNNMIELNEAKKGFMANLTIDGQNIAGINGVYPTAGVSVFHFYNVAFINCAVGLHQGAGTAASRWVDSMCFGCQFDSNAVGFENTELTGRFIGCVFSSQTTAGVRFSHLNDEIGDAEFVECTFVLNAIDLYFDVVGDSATTSVHFTDCRFEQSVNGIVQSAANAICMVLLFDGCTLRSNSAAYLGDFSNFSIMRCSHNSCVLILDTTRTTSMGWNYGANATVIYDEGCQALKDATWYYMHTKGEATILGGNSSQVWAPNVAEAVRKVFLTGTHCEVGDIMADGFGVNTFRVTACRDGVAQNVTANRVVQWEADCSIYQ